MIAIKFRGIRLNGEWAYGLLAISQGYPGQPEAGCYISNSCGMPWAYSVRPETVGQYINFNDKDGKEMCEGDVLGAEGRWFEPTIGFENGQFVVANIGPSISLYDFLEKQHEDFNVIGNIHEN